MQNHLIIIYIFIVSFVLFILWYLIFEHDNGNKPDCKQMEYNYPILIKLSESDKFYAEINRLSDLSKEHYNNNYLDLSISILELIAVHIDAHEKLFDKESYDKYNLENFAKPKLNIECVTIPTMPEDKVENFWWEKSVNELRVVEENKGVFKNTIKY